ncbi:MAG: ABC transporter permease, partial [Fimbriimonadaceae bacterium]|nr:ABC transporter permease [Fimbriimonadaceae bacterium]
MLRFSAPVALAGIGESLGQRAGLLNIGLEGMMLTAAFASMQVSATTGSPWAGLAAGVAAAVLIGLLQALFTLRLMLDQVVVGTAVNLFALGLTGTLFRALYGGSGRLISVPRLPSLPGGWDPFLLFIPIAALAAAWLLARSRWGLGMRAAGEKPEALQAAGFSVPRLRWGAALIAAAFAGLAGSYYTLGITGSFAENTIAGRGFVAIAMVTFGRWNPLGVVLASLLVGLAEQVQFWLQSVNQAVPYQIFAALPYVLALAVLL